MERFKITGSTKRDLKNGCFSDEAVEFPARNDSCEYEQKMREQDLPPVMGIQGLVERSSMSSSRITFSPGT